MSGLDAGERATLDRLAAEADIRALVTRYTHAVDWLDFAALEALFWPEAIIDFGHWQGDRAAFMPYIVEAESGYRRRLHLFSGERIAVNGDKADAEAGCAIHVLNVAGETATDSLMWGRYLFALERRDGVWRFIRLTYISNFVQNFERRAPRRETRDDFLSPEHPLYSEA
jgi:hypothetical protein